MKVVGGTTEAPPSSPLLLYLGSRIAGLDSGTVEPSPHLYTGGRLTTRTGTGFKIDLPAVEARGESSPGWVAQESEGGPATSTWKERVRESDICLLVRTLRIDGAPLHFERAVLIGKLGLDGSEWHILVLGSADPSLVGAAGEEVSILASTAYGRTIAGRARMDRLTPTGGTVQLQGIGPLQRR